MSKPVLIIGGGGHAMVIADILRQLEFKIAAIISKDSPKNCQLFDDIKVLDDKEALIEFSPSDVYLANGIGSMPNTKVRSNLFDHYKKLNYKFLSIISPYSIVSNYAHVSEGVHILPGAIVNPGVTIGENTIINSGAIVEHECSIGKNNHIAPGASLSGSVQTGEFVHIGTGANVIQRVKIGNNSIVGAGATLTKDLDDNSTIFVAKPYLDKGINK
jgi:sugar O-acyltransferase (sialic acid O-acetyltransferase NeuD family)